MQHFARLALIAGATLTACRRDRTATPDGAAEAATVSHHAAVSDSMASWDASDSSEVVRGRLAVPTGTVKDSTGRILVDHDAGKFLAGPAPTTVHPSLWRHAQRNATPGLYQVADGLWQVRGFDLANLTIIRGKTGWIIIDPLTTKETATAALAFAHQQLGAAPVTGVIFTHSHIDHFGGALGVLSAAEAAARQVPIIAPAGFLDEALSENILVGTAMGRRSAYQFGRALPRSATGNVDMGLGPVLAYGTYGVLAPTHEVRDRSERLVVDGVTLVLHNVPGAEAPAELTLAVPERHAYLGAELLAQTMHNLLPLRGAKVRDARQWARYLDDALDDAAGADVLLMSHTWPVWGHDRIARFIETQRDVYQYTQDQTVRLMNAGYTAPEIMNMVRLPAALASALGGRGFYGDLRHNVEATYQFYLGAYDGNPAHLDRLPPAEASARYVALMGGANKVVAAAQAAFDAGDYRWAAELLNHVVFAEPKQAAATALLARTYEQLGYQAESATWRNAYLTGARELRSGPPTQGIDRRAFLPMLELTPVDQFLDAMAAGLNGPAAEGKSFVINLVLTDTHETHVLRLRNSVLHHRRAAAAPDADATLSITKPLFVRVMAGAVGLADLATNDGVSIRGSKLALLRFLSLIDKAPGTFAVVTP